MMPPDDDAATFSDDTQAAASGDPADIWVADDPTRCPVCGRDACEDHLPADTPKPEPRLVFRAAADVLTDPAPVVIVEGVAWAGHVTVLTSESGTGKTFVLLDLAASVSDAVPWHGRAVEAGAVAYVSFEGDAMGIRLRALRESGCRRLSHLYVVRASDPLSPRVTRDGEVPAVGELAAMAALEVLASSLHADGEPPIRLLVVDTIRASLSGPEDKSDNTAAYLRAVRRILATVPGAAGILAHHAGWQDGETPGRKRERGSSAWRGNVDASLYLEAGTYNRLSGEAPLTVTALKVRDGELPAPLHLIRRRVPLSLTDRFGAPLTSCVIDWDRRTAEDRAATVTAATEAEQRTFDLRTLRVIADHPDTATGLDRVRVLMGGVRKATVADAVSRLVVSGWLALPERQRHPYVVTDAGRAVLLEVQS